MPDSLTPSDAVSAQIDHPQIDAAEPTSPSVAGGTAAPMSRREMLATWPKTRTAGLLGGRRAPDRTFAIRGTASCVRQQVKLGTAAGVYLNKMLMPAMQASAISLTRSINFLLSAGFKDAQKVMDIMEEKLATLRRAMENETARLTPLLEPYQVKLEDVVPHNQEEVIVEWFTPLGRQFINALLQADELFRLLDALFMFSVFNLERTNLLTNTYIRNFSHFNRSLSDYAGRSRRALDRSREGGATDRDVAKIFSMSLVSEQDGSDTPSAAEAAETERVLAEARASA